MYQGIALCGRAGTGKDSAYLRLGPDFMRVSFAEQVKILAKQITGVDFLDENVKSQPKNRAFLQHLGTDLMRKMWDDDFWVRQAESKCISALNADFTPVLTDTRFPNEIEMARANDYLIVRLEASPETLEQRGRPMTDHVSETALPHGPHPMYDATIHTDNISPGTVAAVILDYFHGRVV